MSTPQYQVIGRRLGQPQTLLFRDRDGRHFLRAGCGARLVRITARDAERIMRQYDYHSVFDGEWRDVDGAAALDCPLPFAVAAEAAEVPGES